MTNIAISAKEKRMDECVRGIDGEERRQSRELS